VHLAQAQDFPIDSVFLFKDEEALFFEQKSKLDPNRAALYSAVLPGLGQAYNGQYWKIPIIYAGGVVLVHYIQYNNKIYNQFLSAQRAVKDNRTDTVNPFEEFAPGRFPVNSIVRNTQSFRRNRDYMMIWAAGYYLLNIAEAHIAAHLKEFEVNEGLSFKLKPTIQPSPLFSQSAGLSLAITF